MGKNTLWQFRSTMEKLRSIRTKIPIQGVKSESEKWKFCMGKPSLFTFPIHAWIGPGPAIFCSGPQFVVKPFESLYRSDPHHSFLRGLTIHCVSLGSVRGPKLPVKKSVVRVTKKSLNNGAWLCPTAGGDNRAASILPSWVRAAAPSGKN